MSINASYMGFTVSTDNVECIAELSVTDVTMYKDLVGELPDGKWLFFNRLKVMDHLQGQGFGTACLKATLDYCDEMGYNILCELNPYGILDFDNLKRFYAKHDFVDTEYESVMVYIANKR